MSKDIFQGFEQFYKDRYKNWSGKRQFKGSGERLRRLVDEMCWECDAIDFEVAKCLESVFKDPYNEMLVCKNVNVWALCPHHLLPCNFKVYVGYIPNGQVLGLSKFARVAVALAKRPIMQEQYTRELADTFEKNLKPDGLGIYVIGKHGCMGCRGVNQEIEIVTSILKGSLYEDAKAREEFYSVCKTSS